MGVIAILFISHYRRAVKENSFRQVVVFAFIFLLLTIPTIPKMVGYFFSENVESVGINLGRFFHWYPSVEGGKEFIEGYRQDWFDVSVYQLQLLALVFMGLLSTLFNDGRRKIFIASNIFIFYLLAHSDAFGLSIDRNTRQFNQEVLLFAFIIPAIFTLERKDLKRPFLLVSALLLLTYYPERVHLYSLGITNFPKYVRMTPNELEAAFWMRENIPEQSVVFFQGQVYLPVTRWYAAISDKAVVVYDGKQLLFDGIRYDGVQIDYYLFDYTSLILDPSKRSENTIRLYSLEEQMDNQTIVVFENDDVAIRRKK